MKKYFLLFILLIMSNQLLAFDIWIKPQINYNINQDTNLQKYFNSNGIFSPGISMDIMYKYFGIFADINRMKFTAQEAFSSQEYKNKIVQTWSTIGILKNFEFYDLPIFTKIKVGITYHFNDDLNYYRGIFLGSEFGYNITQNFQAGFFLNFNNTTYKVPDYSTYRFTRHNYYLSGKEITDPHFTIGANLAVKIW